VTTRLARSRLLVAITEYVVACGGDPTKRNGPNAFERRTVRETHAAMFKRILDLEAESKREGSE
jgi:hypothetical protein